jgi:hypothetical protein
MIVLLFTASLSRNIIIKLGIVFSTTTLFATGVTLAHVDNTVPAGLAVLASGSFNSFMQVSVTVLRNWNNGDVRAASVRPNDRVWVIALSSSRALEETSSSLELRISKRMVSHMEDAYVLIT